MILAQVTSPDVASEETFKTPQAEPSCAAIRVLLSRTYFDDGSLLTSDGSVRPEVAACRAEIAINRAPELTAELLASIANPGPSRGGRLALLCLLRPPGVTTWFTLGLRTYGSDSLCLASLADEDTVEAKKVVEEYLSTNTYSPKTDLEVDANVSSKRVTGTLVGATRYSRRLALRVAVLLPELLQNHISGYDALQENICGPLNAPHGDALLACAHAPPRQEKNWERARLRHRRIGETVLTVGFPAGLTALSWATRNQSSSRALAVFTFTLGSGLAIDAAIDRNVGGWDSVLAPVWGVLGAIPAGVIAFFVTDHTGAVRPIVTGLGAAGIAIPLTMDVWEAGKDDP